MTGMLHLNLAAKNDISKVMAYPALALNHIEIGYSKEEQKYRFGQFWDSTLDRAEFTSNFINILSTEANGYRYEPNPNYITYVKPAFERKPLRHNFHRVYLIREDEPLMMPKMILKFLNAKSIMSPR